MPLFKNVVFRQHRKEAVLYWQHAGDPDCCSHTKYSGLDLQHAPVLYSNQQCCSGNMCIVDCSTVQEAPVAWLPSWLFCFSYLPGTTIYIKCFLPHSYFPDLPCYRHTVSISINRSTMTAFIFFYVQVYFNAQ